MDAAPETLPADTAPQASAAPGRNVLGIIGLILVLLAVAAPIVGFIYVQVNGGWPGERLSGGLSGFAQLSGFFFAIVVSSFASFPAIVGVILGIVSLTRTGRRKLQGILAIALGAIPSLAIFNFLILASVANPST